MFVYPHEKCNGGLNDFTFEIVYHFFFVDFKCGNANVRLCQVRFTGKHKSSNVVLNHSNIFRVKIIWEHNNTIKHKNFN